MVIVSPTTIGIIGCPSSQNAKEVYTLKICGMTDGRMHNLFRCDTNQCDAPTNLHTQNQTLDSIFHCRDRPIHWLCAAVATITSAHNSEVCPGSNHLTAGNQHTPAANTLHFSASHSMCLAGALSYLHTNAFCSIDEWPYDSFPSKSASWWWSSSSPPSSLRHNIMRHE